MKRRKGNDSRVEGVEGINNVRAREGYTLTHILRVKLTTDLSYRSGGGGKREVIKYYVEQIC